MIALDTSAIVAIALGEAEAEEASLAGRSLFEKRWLELQIWSKAGWYSPPVCMTRLPS